MKKPNFFILGAPKCGTTSLSIYLLSHPQVFFCWPKEPTYFASDYNDYRFIKSEAEYLDQFSGATNEHLAVGEGSTWYLHSRVAVGRILEFNPDARFIVMLRNPATMVHALHSQLFNSCDEDVRDFQRAWNLQEDRKSGRYIPPTCREPSFLQYGDVGKLGAHLDRLYRQVGKDRVHVIIYDDFCEDPLGAYRDALDFLGLSWDGREDFPVSNPNRVMKWPWLGRIATRPSKARIVASGLLRRMLGVKTLGFSDFISRFNYQPRKRPPMPHDLHARLNDHFREDVDRLSRILNRDLRHWCEPPGEPAGYTSSKALSA